MKWYYTIWKLRADKEAELLTEYGFIYLKHYAFHIARRLIKKFPEDDFVVRKISPDTDQCIEWTFEVK